MSIRLISTFLVRCRGAILDPTPPVVPIAGILIEINSCVSNGLRIKPGSVVGVGGNGVGLGA